MKQKADGNSCDITQNCKLHSPNIETLQFKNH